MFPLAPSVTDSTVGLVSLAIASVDALYSSVVAGASVITGPGAAQQPAAFDFFTGTARQSCRHWDAFVVVDDAVQCRA